MISRRIRSGLGVALSMVTVHLTSSAPLLAQEPAGEAPASDAAAAPAAAPAAAGAAEAPKAPPSAEAPPASEPTPAPETEPTPAPEAATPPEAQQPATPAAAEPPAMATAASEGPDLERERTVSLVGVEQLPGSAFPEAYIRGLKHGSLWLTFHGQQWPYMPALEGKPGVRIGLSGYFWNDLSNTNIKMDDRLAAAGFADQTRWQTQTRGILRVTPTYNTGDGWFAQGNGEMVVLGDMRPDPTTQVTATTEDVYVRVGKWNLFDVTVGRFQAWEIANHFGMALDYATLERQGAWVLGEAIPKPTDGYGLTYFWDRQNFLLGTYALHVYPTKYLRGELLGHIGAGNATSSPYQMDVRPSGIFDIGWVKLKAGYEYGKAVPTKDGVKTRDSKNGWGLAAQFVFDPYVEFGGSFARGYEDVVDQFGNVDLEATNTVQTVGGFVNVNPGYEPVLFGFGAFWNHFEDFRIDEAPGPHNGERDTNAQRQLFAAVQYTLWDRMMFKFVFSHAQNTVRDYGNATNYTNNALGGRLRMMITY